MRRRIICAQFFWFDAVLYMYGDIILCIYIFVLDFCQSIEWKWICRTKSNMPVVPIESDWIACERKGKPPKINRKEIYTYIFRARFMCIAYEDKYIYAYILIQYVWKCLVGNFYLKSHTNIAYSRTKTSILLTHCCPIGFWWSRTVTFLKN